MGWLDGYTDDDDDDWGSPPPAEPTAPPPVDVLRCRHCGSDRLHVRSSDAQSTSVQFRCQCCDRRTTHVLPFGYQRVYRAVTD